MNEEQLLDLFPEFSKYDRNPRECFMCKKQFTLKDDDPNFRNICHDCGTGPQPHSTAKEHRP